MAINALDYRAVELDAGRHWGGRLDLRFGQATETLQGNPANEPRPQIYRNVFQAYATYIILLGKGVDVDFGKWGSSLGIEGNYTKDQINYSRSYWFNFLPFYHMGFRATIPVSNAFSLNFWLVNGTNQVEATNGCKVFSARNRPLPPLVSYGGGEGERALGDTCSKPYLRRWIMQDVLWIALTIAFFVLSIGYVRFCDRMK